MKQVYRIDNQGFYIEPVILEENDKLTPDCVEEIPTMGLYRAQYVDGRWAEGMPQEEIEAIKNTPQPLAELEQLKKQVADLGFQLMINGVI